MKEQTPGTRQLLFKGKDEKPPVKPGQSLLGKTVTGEVHRKVAQNEEGPRGSLGLQSIQHLGYVAVLVARVEGEIDHLVGGVRVGVGVVDIVAAVLLHLREGRVGHGLGVVLGADTVPARPRGLGGKDQSRKQEKGREQGGCELMEAGDGIGIVHGLRLLSVKNGVCTQ